MVPQPVLLLAGPTAIGKSEVALCLAEKLKGEIVSVDSMQVYRGLDIGTAKPSAEDRARVPHHLIDVADLTEPFDAAQFLRLAREAVSQIHSRGRAPILCGGTGLYFKAFLSGVGEAPPANQALRAELEAKPLTELLEELEAADPVSYQTIDRQNRRRVVRALEVIRLTGRPFSQQRADWRRASANAGQTVFACGLSRAMPQLRQRIDARVEAMFRLGLVAETKQLLERGLAQNRTAMQALGYRQAVEHLHGERSLRDTIELVKVRTRQFAKRQMTWFRRQLELTWIPIESGSSAAVIAEEIATAWMARENCNH